MIERRFDFDLQRYSERVTSQRVCFICEIASAPPAQTRPIIYRDDEHIAFFSRYPTVLGYTLVAPVAHREQVVGDFTRDEYVSIQSLIHRLGIAITAVVPTERLYVLSLGSQQANSHVHWHLAPLPPGVAYEEQQFAALMVERAGYLDVDRDTQVDLARRIRDAMP